ncbi:MAG TPA: hypothetical protein VGH28_02010 [Polyangiaceae bacterium]
MNFRILRLGLLPLALGTACFLGGNPSAGPDSGVPTPDGGGVLPFQADSPFVYVSKVKNILTGLAASQQEVDSVANAPDDASKQAALVALIDQWMTTPEYASKMQTFFELAFQQTQISETDFTEIVPNGNGSIGLSPYASLLIQNVKESFARTMLELISEGQPISAAFTTTKFMMTPALAELYAYMDWNQVDDNEKISDKFAALMKTTGITVEDTTKVDYATQTLKQGDPNYMVWYFPGLNSIQPLGPNNPSGCQTDSRDWISTNMNNVPSAHLVHFLLYGGLEAYKINNGPPPNNNCNAYQSQNANAIFQQSDFSTWKMMSVRPPKSGEAITPFWDVPSLRSASELVLGIPRVGFFSTPAFHANWQTNTSNTMRVTINQAFIVALGAQVDGTDTTPLSMIPQNPPGLDQAHVASGQACVSCHQILDPSRSIFMANWSDAYGIQTNASQTKGEFIFNGVVAPVTTLTDFGNQLAQHPYFPDAWVQKLCFFANSQKCDPTDPEFTRIRDDFKNSGFQWKKLVEDVMSSPITTNAVATTTTTNEGEMISVSRRDHLCTLLNARLGLTDVCGLDVVTTKSLVGVPEIAAGLPSDGYGRGASVPVLPTQPTLFYRAGLENICEDVANMIIDNKSPPAGATTYSSTAADAAIADFVLNLMSIVPDDPRSQPMTQMLTDHHTQALANKATATDALKSTFVAACLSPTVAGIGM